MALIIKEGPRMIYPTLLKLQITFFWKKIPSSCQGLGVLAAVLLNITKFWIFTEVGFKFFLVFYPAKILKMPCEIICHQPGNHRRHGFNPWVSQFPRRRKWQPTPVFLPKKSNGQRNLAGYSPKDCKESDTTEHTHHKGEKKSAKYTITLWIVKCIPNSNLFKHEDMPRGGGMYLLEISYIHILNNWERRG